MVTLVIMDGFGIRNNKKGNAIMEQGVPNLTELKNKYPSMEISASGNAVGLPAKQMGNSEAGHLTIGAGRRFYQPLEKINRAIRNGEFNRNPQLLKVMKHVKAHNTALHIIGLVSNGGIHSHIEHIKQTIKLAYKQKLDNVYLHIILDGRDTPQTSGLKFVKEIEKVCSNYNCIIKTVSGRVWAMDREGYYDRTQKAYNAIVLGHAMYYGDDAIDEIEESYKKGVTDEFFEPTVIGDTVPFKENDGVIICNFRKDRMRQLCEALTLEKKFDHFPVKNFRRLCVVGFVEYDDDFREIGIAFPEMPLKNGLSRMLSLNKVPQLHISETSKFPHVTYYFDCGRDEPYRFEEQVKIDGFQDIRYEKHPKMKAKELTNAVLEAIESNKYEFIVVNFPNCDMIGHTANFEATKEAVSIVDKCVKTIADATLLADGECIITADHGNAEEMWEKDGAPKTSHTANPVPFILVSNKEYQLVKKGELANIAPTILELLNIEPPTEMTTSLIKHDKKK